MRPPCRDGPSRGFQGAQCGPLVYVTLRVFLVRGRVRWSCGDSRGRADPPQAGSSEAEAGGVLGTSVESQKLFAETVDLLRDWHLSHPERSGFCCFSLERLSAL